MGDPRYSAPLDAPADAFELGPPPISKPSLKRAYPKTESYQTRLIPRFAVGN